MYVLGCNCFLSCILLLSIIVIVVDDGLGLYELWSIVKLSEHFQIKKPYPRQLGNFPQLEEQEEPEEEFEVWFGKLLASWF